MPYDEAPSRRMAWDADGTVLTSRKELSGVLGNEGASNMAELNDEDNTMVTPVSGHDGNSNFYWTHTFPELREFDGIFVGGDLSNASEPKSMASSGDTTNGADGTWTQRIADMDNHGSVYDKFRNNIVSQAVQSVKGVRVEWRVGNTANGKVMAIHLYGKISPGETPDRIIFLDTENSDAEFTKVLDFGDKPRGQTTTRTFKIKNNSSTKTINTIQITAEDLYLNAGDWYAFGDDGVVYQATHDVGNLGPGVTELVHLKQIIPDAETLGLQIGRILVSHASVT